MKRALVCAAIVAALAAIPAGSAKKPAKFAPTATAAYTVAADGFHLTVTSCGWDFVGLVDGKAGGPEIRWTLPDGSTQQFGVGMWVGGCLDGNTLVSDQTGLYSVTVTQPEPGADLSASASVTVG